MKVIPAASRPNTEWGKRVSLSAPTSGNPDLRDDERGLTADVRFKQATTTTTTPSLLCQSFDAALFALAVWIFCRFCFFLLLLSLLLSSVKGKEGGG